MAEETDIELDKFIKYLMDLRAGKARGDFKVVFNDGKTLHKVRTVCIATHSERIEPFILIQ